MKSSEVPTKTLRVTDVCVAAVEHASADAPLYPSVIRVHVQSSPVSGSVTTTPTRSRLAVVASSTSGGSRYGGSKNHCFPMARNRM